MIVKTVKDLVENAEIGDAISACRGKIKAVFQYYSGPSKRKGAKKGEVYQIQNLILSDLDDPNITLNCLLSGRDEMPQDWIGKTVHLISHEGLPRKLSGLEITERKKEYGGGKELKITPSAEITPRFQLVQTPEIDGVPDGPIEDASESTLGEPEPSTLPPKPESLQQPKPEANSKPSMLDEAAAKAVHSCKLQACRNANVWLIAAQAQRQARVQYQRLTGDGLTEEQFQGSIAMNAIQLFQMGHHVKMQVKPIEPKVKQ